tara:strand:- start:62 stop:301 length:240 start_codon:yes stop_codon:yes gene_type:complete
MNSKYLNSVLINHERAGFCILEFGINSTNSPKNPKVVMSTGNSFNKIAFTILQNIKIPTGIIDSTQDSKAIRLPIYFKN